MERVGHAHSIMAAIPEAFALAIQHHQAGQLSEAEKIYRQILAVDPNYADALHLLGLIAHQVGQHELARQYVECAIEQHAGAAMFHNNLGEIYRAIGNLPKAEACYRRALAIQPDY